ncbi:ribosome small subunit-dependent GTPase A [Propioniciclava tarda]|uniref:Small ribosomal subunit biogenesis GTPase RsgA n=1 Tax=Propioniciclava tarda TaxID=433330 RepID=A0A4Q9KL20_PROTD|nr:ribosome small subunit-dependent GTPase A [Propioniciclava tarda]TBT95173.1 ribosome small subunit-dependent GTPase A [Propioniciclava tarda]SMO51601.1 ribosome biogenesis GTPase [Propioniciclava tarda]HOA88983.1 ribosome small subunit-dependent GTPase A [Propioniciclava tarda]HQA30223.1 ribosome small subunit-dependent GTPase A [Propioniciclava tarda]HQD61492.1 ribosome small subunit-dependent GTPase A [Propioniciclava tarda]
MAIKGRLGVRHDEDDGYGRPARRTRPRTKDRPDYSGSETGYVVAVDRGRFTVLVDNDQGLRELSCTKARQLGRKGVIVGDEVQVVGDTSGADGTLARIVGVVERRSVLRRTADDDDPFERPIVANADQLAIVTALADPPPRPGMIDRILVAAYDAGLWPLLVLTKADLSSPDELSALYRDLDVTVLSTHPGSDLDELRDELAGHRTVFVGHSGVGKSTLVNALIPDAGRAIGHVNQVTGRGRHTSTSAVALQLPGGGWVIDTPGVRSFGLSHVTTDSIIAAFPDLADLVGDCPRACAHDTSAAQCALDAAVQRGDLASSRLESFRRMEKAWITPDHDLR